LSSSEWFVGVDAFVTIPSNSFWTGPSSQHSVDGRVDRRARARERLVWSTVLSTVAGPLAQGGLLANRRIVVALLSEDQEFQRLQGNDARAAGKRHGVDIDVVYAANNSVAQIQQIYNDIHRPEGRPIAIVVETVAGEGIERVATAATAAGIGWILINRHVPYMDALRRKYPHMPVAIVGTDQVEVGRIQARQIRAATPPGGTVLYIQGPSDTSAARERLRGAQEGLSGSGITLKVLDGNWSEASGESAIQSWLRLKTSENERPAMIACQNDGMAVGARRAALAAARTRPEFARIPLIGCDGVPNGGQRLVNMQHLAATVVTPPNTGPAVDLVVRMLKTRQAPPPETLLKPVSFPPEREIAQRLKSRT
jgi:ribose transport system substrate-binding protein